MNTRRTFLASCFSYLASLPLVGWMVGKDSKPTPPKWKWRITYTFTNKRGASWQSYCLADGFSPRAAVRLIGKPAVDVLEGRYVDARLNFPLTEFSATRIPT